MRLILAVALLAGSLWFWWAVLEWVAGAWGLVPAIILGAILFGRVGAR